MTSLKYIITAVLLGVFVATANANKKFAQTDVVQTRETGDAAVVGDDLPVSRALAAKMIALAYNDMETINAEPRVAAFSDTDSDKWYDKYVNIVYAQGIMGGYGGKFAPSDPLTLSQAQVLLSRDEKMQKLRITDENRDKPVSYALWVSLYKKLVSDLENTEIAQKNIIVLATHAQNEKLPQYAMVTDIGVFTYQGLVLDGYLDREISVLCKNDEIVAIESASNTPPTIKNCTVTAHGNDKIGIEVSGVYREFACSPKLDIKVGDLCDITVNDGRVIYYSKS
ncbi:hypothetical protein FACS1894188_06130 [Clostridia bacterium]|nr:hypothetical protein FACS1894188_06130 [Clostridia bacterium]